MAVSRPRRRASARTQRLARCLPFSLRGGGLERSRAASLRRTSQSAAASRAPSVPSASNCKTVVRSRVTFFIDRCRSTRTLCLKGHRGGLKIQPRCRPVLMPRSPRQQTLRARDRCPMSTPICSGWNRHSLIGPNRRLGRSIKACTLGAAACLPCGDSVAQTYPSATNRCSFIDAIGKDSFRRLAAAQPQTPVCAKASRVPS